MDPVRGIGATLRNELLDASLAHELVTARPRQTGHIDKDLK
ncbi:hypothetical protein ACVDG5_019345 [Mesorhizobium sp. ORM6]